LLRKPRKKGRNNPNTFDGGEGTESRKRAKTSRVKFCPRCGSVHIFWASGLPQLWSIWQCRDCGYRGALVIEDGKLAEKIRAEHSKEAMRSKA
jgi:predicted RNA-binding Zn-ribbon protein involved in translation (DUF1610 family)